MLHIREGIEFGTKESVLGREDWSDVLFSSIMW